MSNVAHITSRRGHRQVGCLGARALALALACLSTWIVWPTIAEARKIFIREISVDTDCVPTSPSVLLAMVAEEIPYEVLQRRDMQYEDIGPYLDMSKWGAQSRDVREEQNILRRLQQLDMQYMLSFEVTCIPGSLSRTYIVTGQLIDLDVMDRILACPDSQAAIVNGRRTCNDGGQVFDAVTYAHVKFESFDDFAPSVRELLARLLQIPLLELTTNISQTYAPAAIIEIPYFIRRNVSRGMDARQPPGISYIITQDAVELPGDVAAQICAHPEAYWDRIHCSVKTAQRHCDRADVVQIEVRSFVHSETLSHRDADGQEAARITINSPPHAATILLRTDIREQTETGALLASPHFACIHIKEKKRSFGAAAYMGFYQDMKRSTREIPQAGLVPFSPRIDLYFTQLTRERRSRFFSTNRLGGSFGVSRLGGISPCPSGDIDDCADPIARPTTLSTSTTFEFKMQSGGDMIRIGPWAFRYMSDIGIGVEHLTSTPSYERDGIAPILLLSLGTGAVYYSHSAPGSSSMVYGLGLFYHMRIRLAPAETEDRGQPYSAGVPDYVNGWSVVYIGEYVF